MSHDIERYASALGATFEPTRLVFDLSESGREILNALSVRTPHIVDAFESVRRRIPLPKNAEAGVEGRFYRLPNHNRSFCYALSDSNSLADAPTLVFKGAEPLLNDFQTMLNWMAQAPLRKSSRVMADHFPLGEGKIPGALSSKEAIREAQIALDVQKGHLRHYGELAMIPTPLLVHSISDARMIACTEILRHNLSTAAFDRIDPVLQSGLAIYIYHYPSSPIRANYWGDLGVPPFKQFFEKLPEENSTVAGWVRLVIRLLYLGYLPYSVRNEGLGACMDFGNAALGGGFCDPDSIVAIDAGMDDEFFRESVIQTLEILQRTIQLTIGLSGSTTLYQSIEEFACRQYIHYLVNCAIISEERPGLRLDDRFLQLTSPRSISEVKSCANRKSRVPSYIQFSRRSREADARRRSDGSFP
jgi:hypothetical protein